MKTKHSFARSGLAGLAISFLALSPLFGQNAIYTGPEDGGFYDPANWAGGLLPSTGNVLLMGDAPSNYNLREAGPSELDQFQVARGAPNSLTVLPGGEVHAADQAVVGILSNGVGTLNIDGGIMIANRLRMSIHGGAGEVNPGGSVVNLNQGSITLTGLLGDIEIGLDAPAAVNLNGGELNCVAIKLMNGELNINGAAGTFSASEAFNFGLAGRTTSLTFTVDDTGNVSSLNAGSLGPLVGTHSLTVSGVADGSEAIPAELLLLRLAADTFSPDELAALQANLSLNAATGTVELRNGDTELWFNGTVTVPSNAWETDFTALAAPVALDFGEGKDTVNDLLRHRPQDFVLQADSVRYEPTATETITSTALASLASYTAGQNFQIGSTMTIAALPEPGPNRAGLVVLGGPHVPGVDPFTSAANDSFFSLTLHPGETSGALPSLRIREGYTGLILAEEVWAGQPLFATTSLFGDDFEDAAASGAAWSSGGTNNVWEVGAPTSGPGAASSGANVFATDLDGSFQQVTEAWLRSPVIDLTVADGAVLSYADFHQLDNAIDFHSATVRVLDAGTEQEIEVLSVTTGTTADWRLQEFPLSQDSLGAGQVILEFHLKTDSFATVAGWYIDDVQVSTVGSSLPATYTLSAEGTFDTGGNLDLSFTVSEGSTEQTISASISDPFVGNLFGIGGRSRIQAEGSPAFDFDDLSITLGPKPAISSIANQTIFADSSTGPLAFTLSDDQADPSALTVTGASSNPALVPEANIVIAGEGEARTATVTPLPEQDGTATITLTVSGGTGTSAITFVVNVEPIPPPTISGITEQIIAVNTSTEALPLTIGHEVIDLAAITVFGSSSNTTLVPDENIVIGGSGAARTVTVTPVADMTGLATITVVADDGARWSSISFDVFVLSDAEPAVTKIVDPVEEVPADFFLNRAWNWDTDGDMEGWTPSDHLLLDAGAPVGGLISGVSGDVDPQWTSPASLGIPATEEMIIEFRIRKDAIDATRMDLFWADVNGGFAGTRSASLEANELPIDGEFHVVRIHFTNAIQGFLSQFRFDPISNAEGINRTFDLDYFRVYTTEPPEAPAAPKLTIQQVNETGVRLSWPVGATGWTLQRSLDLSSGFTAAELETVVEEDENAAYDTVTGTRQFYRLSQ